MEIIIATHNQGKVDEIELIHHDWQQTNIRDFSNIKFLPHQHLVKKEVAETGLSFVENALIKARFSATITKQPTLADDSGLVIPALNGAPGIYSARYAGVKNNFHQNMQLVLQKLVGSKNSTRAAYFHCCLAFIRHPLDQHPIIVTGNWHGYIHTQMQGEFGFGYDPIFWLPELNCTVAQLSPAKKITLSHRSLALKSLYKNPDFVQFALAGKKDSTSVLL